MSAPPDEKDPEAPGRREPISDDPRPLTIDDVPRLGSGSGIAVGCGGFVLAAIVIFWLVRGWVMTAP